MKLVFTCKLTTRHIFHIKDEKHQEPLFSMFVWGHRYILGLEVSPYLWTSILLILKVLVFSC
jgi:hypothetical protein